MYLITYHDGTDYKNTTAKNVIKWLKSKQADDKTYKIIHKEKVRDSEKVEVLKFKGL